VYAIPPREWRQRHAGPHERIGETQERRRVLLVEASQVLGDVQHCRFRRRGQIVVTHGLEFSWELTAFQQFPTYFGVIPQHKR
jgi:hypothetical protein